MATFKERLMDRLRDATVTEERAGTMSSPLFYGIMNHSEVKARKRDNALIASVARASAVQYATPPQRDAALREILSLALLRLGPPGDDRPAKGGHRQRPHQR
ncbi:hypothetical protein CHELA20_11031 [Hyphomicrobiales bacterium]|nr:hypothetical protein CHELA20_11031 [Hyphomicrobiales bacterium]CAH1694688.1 hypothetical protein CHELA41_51262 [Hyphomicrobiales bacterium]